MQCILEFNQSQQLKQYVEFNTKKKEKIIEVEKKYKLINNAVHGKTIKNVRNRIDVKLVSNKKYYLKWASNPHYMLQKIFDNDLITKKQKLH